jgi:hypothetical protein
MLEDNKPHNPLIYKLNKSNSIPGTTFRLPSRGKSYTNGELADDVKDGEVLIYPMSTLDEIYLKTPDMLFQGTAIEKSISRCCPQVLQPLNLLSKDVDYILTCMRLVSYGNILIVPFTCTCEKGKDKEVDLEVPISDFLNKTKNMTDDEVNKLSFELDGFAIKTRYVTFGQMVLLNQENMNNGDNPDDIFKTFITNVAANIESIDNVDDNSMIVEFLKAQQRKFQMGLLKHIQDVNEWGMNFDYKFKCKYCDKNKSVSISLNPASFFSEPSNQDQATKSAD